MGKTMMSCQRWAASVVVLSGMLGCTAFQPSVVAAGELQPVRPVPGVSVRPAPATGSFYVDPGKGADRNDGSRERPWRTINHGLSRLAAGETLCLRGGTYYEHVVVPRSGEPDRPITLRSCRGELAWIDGGIREFLDSSGESWMPLKGGAEGEYVSTKTYPLFAQRPIVHAFPAAGWEPFFGKEDERPVVLGHFATSMVPLHGYRTLTDLRDTSMLWDVDNKFAKAQGVYCGPGVWFNRETGRIHIRLGHTTLAGLDELAYLGETDPRKVPLRISGPYGADVLRINGVSHLVIQDVVLCGASGSPLVNLYGADHVTFDGVTFYGGSPGLLIKATSNLKIVHCAFRGLAAPWSSRSSMKYRGTPSYRIISQRNKPESHDCEIAWSEFTDDHDGLWLRYLHNLRFHHNLVDNFNDDGLEFGAKKHDHLIHVYQNLVSRCLLTLTLHQMDTGESAAKAGESSGIYITRNIFDLRGGVFRGYPRKPDPAGMYRRKTGTLCGDHGSPTWPNYYFYHNTVLRTEPSWRGYYGCGVGGRATRDSRRRVFNNIFLQTEGLPGLVFSSGPDDIQVDGNLHWGLEQGPKFEGDFFKVQGRRGAFRRKPYPESWMVHDVFADPKLLPLGGAGDSGVAGVAGKVRVGVSLGQGSAAVNAGVALPAGAEGPWHDPLREADAGRPDIGAVPGGHKPWTVGIGGRVTLAGKITPRR